MHSLRHARWCGVFGLSKSWLTLLVAWLTLLVAGWGLSTEEGLKKLIVWSWCGPLSTAAAACECACRRHRSLASRTLALRVWRLNAHQAQVEFPLVLGTSA